MIPQILTITGPSCSGKSTLEARLKAAGLSSIRSFTTRPKRTGEIDGQHYDFRSDDWVEDQLAAGLVVELNAFAGFKYGITVQSIFDAARSGSLLIKVLEPSGVETLKRLQTGRWDIYSVFLSVPREKLYERFVQRIKGDQEADAAYYAERLHLLTSKEVSWEAEFTHLWDVVYSNAREHSIEQIANTILRNHSRAAA